MLSFGDGGQKEQKLSLMIHDSKISKISKSILKLLQGKMTQQGHPLLKSSLLHLPLQFGGGKSLVDSRNSIGKKRSQSLLLEHLQTGILEQRIK